MPLPHGRSPADNIFIILGLRNNSSTYLLPVPFPTYACHMPEIQKWVVLVFIALVALSPVFEIFDKTDGLAQDTTDLVRYVLCLFSFLAFSLRRIRIPFRFTSLRRWIIGPMQGPPIEGKLSAVFLQGPADRGLFLTFHDLRI